MYAMQDMLFAGAGARAAVPFTGHHWAVFSGTDAVVIPLPRNSVTNGNGRFQSGGHLRKPLENTASFGSLAMETTSEYNSMFQQIGFPIARFARIDHRTFCSSAP